jgi:hypothetical protein
MHLRPMPQRVIIVDALQRAQAFDAVDQPMTEVAEPQGDVRNGSMLSKNVPFALGLIHSDSWRLGCSNAMPSGTGVTVQANAARLRIGGRPRVRKARVLRFCTIAAKWNSSRAPESPLSRIRSKL